MLFYRFCRYLLILLLLVGVTGAAHALEVGKRVFGSEVAKDLAYAENFHGKANLLVVYYPNPDLKSESPPELVEEFKAKYDTVIAWRQASETQEIALFIIDKSGYVRWKHSNGEAANPTDDELRTELAKLKRNTPLPIGSPAPDFNLTETDRKTAFKLSNYKGKKNVLVSLLLQTY